MTHIAGHDRSQTLLLPESLDDYVGPENPVRFIEAFVDGLDLTTAGFICVAAKRTGRPGYDPADLLKLYIYGYLNRVRSSRRLGAVGAGNVGHDPDSNPSCAKPESVATKISHGLMWTAEDSKIFFRHRFCLAEVSLFCRRPEIASAPRAAAVKHGRRPPPEAARSVLDRGEHDASLDWPVRCHVENNSHIRFESAARRWQRSGQSRPYVRPVTRPWPLAIMGVRGRVRHQSALACSRHVTVCGIA